MIKESNSIYNNKKTGFCQRDIKYGYMPPYFNKKMEKWQIGIRSTEHLTTDHFMDCVKDGVWQEEIQKIREIVANGKRGTPEHEQAKTALPAITISVDCDTRKKDSQNVLNYNNELQFDADFHLPTEELKPHFDNIIKMPFIKWSMVSPSGDGIKSAISFDFSEPVEITIENIRQVHKAVFEMVDDHLFQSIGIRNDPAVKDPWRVCLVSSDENAYYNPDPVPFLIDVDELKRRMEKQPIEIHQNNGDNESKKKFIDRLTKRMCDKIRKAETGNRHNTILSCSRLIGGYLFDSDIDETEILAELLNAADEIRTETAGELNLTTIKNGIKYGKEYPLEFDNTEMVADDLYFRLSDEEKRDFMSSETGDNTLGKFVFRHFSKDVLVWVQGNAGGVWYEYDRTKGLWKNSRDTKDGEPKDYFAVFCDAVMIIIKKLKQDELEAYKEISAKLEEINNIFYDNKYNPKKPDTSKKCHETLSEYNDLLKKEAKHKKNIAALTEKIVKLESVSGRTNIEKIVQKERKINPNWMDNENNRFKVLFANGVLDMKTKEFSKHNPNDYATLGIDYNYNPDAACPEFDKFMNICFDNNEELIKYVWWVLSTGLVGEAIEKFFVATGQANRDFNGGNGKSFLLDIVRTLLGSYSAVVKASLFLDPPQNSDAGAIALATLKGKRFVSTTDIPKGVKITDTIKENVSRSDEIIGRVLYMGIVSFKASYTVWGMCNGIPQITSDSLGMKRRLAFIPFNHQFITKNDNSHNNDYFKNLYLSEAEGILNKLVNTYWECAGNIPNEPEEISIRSENAFTDNVHKSSLQLYLESDHLIKDPRGAIPITEFKTQYRFFVDTLLNSQLIGDQKITAEMRTNGFEDGNKWINGKTHKCYLGIRFATENDKRHIEQSEPTLPLDTAEPEQLMTKADVIHIREFLGKLNNPLERLRAVMT